VRVFENLCVIRYVDIAETVRAITTYRKTQADFAFQRYVWIRKDADAIATARSVDKVIAGPGFRLHLGRRAAYRRRASPRQNALLLKLQVRRRLGALARKLSPLSIMFDGVEHGLGRTYGREFIPTEDHQAVGVGVFPTSPEAHFGGVRLDVRRTAAASIAGESVIVVTSAATAAASTVVSATAAAAVTADTVVVGAVTVRIKPSASPVASMT
jgi:hypothetical protein